MGRDIRLHYEQVATVALLLAALLPLYFLLTGFAVLGPNDAPLRCGSTITELGRDRSTTADPTGTYNQYDFVIDTAGLPPHPIATASRFGIWPEAYYMTVNQFGDSGSAGFGIYAFDRTAMLSGAPAGNGVVERRS